MRQAKTFNLYSKIRSALRKVWMYSPDRRNALKAAKTPDGKYYCVFCRKFFDKWAMDVDHISGCGPLTDMSHVETFVRDLFTGELVAMCKPCHKLKTKEQRRKRG